MIGESPAHSKRCSLRNRLLSPQSPPESVIKVFAQKKKKHSSLGTYNHTFFTYYTLRSSDFEIQALHYIEVPQSLT